MKVLLVFPRIEHGASTYKDKGSWNSIMGTFFLDSKYLAGQIVVLFFALALM